MAKTLKSELAASALTCGSVVTIAIAVLLASPVFASSNVTRSPISEELRRYVNPDVHYQRKDLVDDENAWMSWEKSVEAFRRIEHSKARKYIEPGEMGFSLNDAEAWLRENTNTLALLDYGIARGKCQFPYPDQGYHTRVPYLGTLSLLADAKLLRAKVRMRKGQFEEAAQDLTGLLAMSELVANAGGGFAALGCAWAIDRRTTEGIAAQLRYHTVRSQVLQQLLSATTFAHDPIESLHNALRLEMECFLMFTSEWPENLTNATETEIVMGTLPKGMKMPPTPEAGRTNGFNVWLGAGSFGYHKALLSGHPNALDKPATVKLYSDYLAHHAQAAKLPITTQQTNEPNGNLTACSSELDQFWNSIPTIRSNRSHFIHLAGDDLVKAQRALAQIDNPVGKQIVLNTVRSTLEHPMRYPFFSRAEENAAWRLGREVVRTFVALRLYWDRGGKLPRDLARLVECAILPSMPIDPFSGETLQYSERNRLLWSDVMETRINDRSWSSRDLKFAWELPLPAGTRGH